MRGPAFAVLALALAMLGCRFGGPTGVAETPAASDAAPVVPDVTPPVDLVSQVDQQPEGPADASAGDTMVSACGGPFTPAVCDPVCNRGCPALSRCDVGATPQTGACVGIWIAEEGASCFKGTGTDACAPRLTCLSGRCRRLCYRHADCTAGTCCKETVYAGSAPSGFRVCGPC